MIGIGVMGLGALAAAPAAAVTLTSTPAGSPLCLSAGAPAACNGGGAGLSGHTHGYDISALLGTTYILTGAELVLGVSDDGGRADGSEKITITLDGVDVPHSGDVQHDIVLPLDLSLLSDNQLAVALGVASGDFFFAGSTLTLTLEEKPLPPLTLPQSEEDGTTEPPASAAVPAPAAGLLLVAGLGALLAARRRAVPRGLDR